MARIEFEITLELGAIQSIKYCSVCDILYLRFRILHKIPASSM